MRYIIILAVLIVAGSSLKAQQASLPVDTIASRHSRMLASRLSLTSVQQQKIETAFKHRHSDLQKISDVRDSTERLQALKKVHKKYDAAMKSIMTPEQFKNYEALLAGKREAVRKRSESKGIRTKFLD